MRPAIGIVLSLLYVPGIAAAQTGSCSGDSVSGIVGLAVPDGAGGMSSIQAASVPFVFGAAECECGSDDIALDIFLTAAFPQGTVGSAELWTGAGCDANITARTTQGSTTCEKLGVVDFSQFVVGNTSASGHIYLPLSALALFSPVTHECPTTMVANGVYVLFFSGAQSNPTGTPYATCSLELTENPEPPGAPVNLAATPDEDSVTLSWSPPDASEPQPTYYQVLCADAADAPLANAPAAAYSICGAGGLERRPLPTGGTVSLPVGDLSALDDSYVCSDPIPIASSGGSARITGLDAGKSYQFLVVAVDAYGNAAPSSVVSATTTAPPEVSHNGCSAAPGQSAAGPASLVLACLTLLLARARRA